MDFDLQPTLTGDFVELRPLRSEDRDDLYAVAADPRVWEQHPVKNRHEEGAFRAFFAEALDSGGALTVIDTRTNGVIGSSRFHGYCQEKSEVEIGWSFLARSHWGGVYNGEMKKLMLQHSFRFVESVVLLISPENQRSQRAAEKVGGVREGNDGQGRIIFRITAPA